jgi:uncharacterized protein (TIGR02266 family)
MKGRPTIVVVDDLPIFRELAAVALAPMARVLSASDDDAALALVRRERPQLVLARYPSTGQGEVSICELVKQDPELAHIPVILVTSGDRPEHHAAAVLAGAEDVLTKPLDHVTLLAAVRRLVDANALRGLPRVHVETPVRIACEGGEVWGIARNLSRGGIFIETDLTVEPRTELRLEFPLPGKKSVLAPTAAVVWCRIPIGRASRGLGLRFLALDGASARSLEHFVHEHRGAPPPLGLQEVVG